MTDILPHPIRLTPRCLRQSRVTSLKEQIMGKTGRKRRARKKNKANHGKRPNA
jgi:hypothetical protein